MKANVVQMMPADGWYAVYVDLEDEELERGYRFEPLIAWGLISFPNDARTFGGERSKVVGLVRGKHGEVEDVRKENMLSETAVSGYCGYVDEEIKKGSTLRARTAIAEMEQLIDHYNEHPSQLEDQQNDSGY